MALNQKLSSAAASAAADALARLLDNGFLRLYSGVQPTDADTALSGNTLLAELRFAATSAPGAVAGVLTFNALTSDTSADATGTATFFRAFKSDGTTVVIDGSVAAAGANLNLNAVALVAGAQVTVNSFTYTGSKT